MPTTREAVAAAPPTSSRSRSGCRSARPCAPSSVSTRPRPTPTRSGCSPRTRHRSRTPWRPGRHPRDGEVRRDRRAEAREWDEPGRIVSRSHHDEIRAQRPDRRGRARPGPARRTQRRARPRSGRHARAAFRVAVARRVRSGAADRRRRARPLRPRAPRRAPRRSRARGTRAVRRHRRRRRPGRGAPRTPSRPRARPAAQLHRRLAYAPPRRCRCTGSAFLPLAVLRSRCGCCSSRRPARSPASSGRRCTRYSGARVASRPPTPARARSAGRPSPAANAARRSCAVRRQHAAEARRERARGRAQELQFIGTGGGWVLLGAAAASVGLFLWLIGARGSRRRGLLPLSDSVAELWRNAAYGWRDIGAGIRRGRRPLRRRARGARDACVLGAVVRRRRALAHRDPRPRRSAPGSPRPA